MPFEETQQARVSGVLYNQAVRELRDAYLTIAILQDEVDWYENENTELEDKVNAAQRELTR